MVSDDLVFRGVIFGIIGGIVIAIIIGMAGCMPGYSEGERTGVITKLSRKGVIWKTWEGEMNLGGMSPGRDGKMTLNVWRFTVEGDEMVGKIQDLQKSQKPATLKYKEWLVGPAPRTSSGCLITDCTFR